MLKESVDLLLGLKYVVDVVCIRAFALSGKVWEQQMYASAKICVILVTE